MIIIKSLCVVIVILLFTGCINGARSTSYAAHRGIGLSFAEMVSRPVSYTLVKMIPLGLCIIKKASYKKGQHYFFAESLCGEASHENCVIYNQVNASGIVINAWVDKELSQLWQEERGSDKPLTLYCDEAIRKREDMDWRAWVTVN